MAVLQSKHLSVAKFEDGRLKTLEHGRDMDNAFIDREMTLAHSYLMIVYGMSEMSKKGS